jgi:hypothetical protein
MSTVALRGKLEYDESSKEWKWEGLWAFGNSLAEVSSLSAPTKTTKTVGRPSLSPSASKTASSQPFIYKWKEKVDPTEIPVPSLNVVIIGGDDDYDDDDDIDGGDDNDDNKDDKEQQQKETTSTSAPTSNDNTINEENEKSTTVENDNSNTAAATATSRALSSPTTKDNQKLIDDHSNNKKKITEKSAEQQETKGSSSIDFKKVDVDVAKQEEKTSTYSHDDNKIDKDNIKVDTSTATSSSPSATVPATTTTTAHKGMEEMKPKKDSSASSTNKVNETAATEMKNTQVDTIPSMSSKTEEAMNDNNQKESTDQKTSTENKDSAANTSSATLASPSTPFETPKSKPTKPPPVMFDSLMKDFTDACTKYSNKADDDNNDVKFEKCPPPSGKWEGYFENVTGQNRNKFQKVEVQEIDETFYLFFHATPGPNPVFTFEDDTTKSHIPVVTESDPPLVQVRGCGTNQFGTFEILGFLDLRTMIVEIQRQYVMTERRINKRRSSSGTRTSSRPYSTRKRQPTWKRKSYDPEEDTYGRKKRSRTSPQQQQQQQQQQKQQPKPAESASQSGEATALASATSSLNLASASTGLPGGGPDIAHVAAVHPGNVESKPSNFPISGLRIVLPTQASSGGTKRKRSGSGDGVRSKRNSRAAGKSGLTPTSISAGTGHGSSPFIRLPAAGDPKKARWRAAHFLYYQRHDPEENDTASTTSGNSPKVTPKPKYVIYEGEMVDNKREGHGICLYNNGLLYEGEWKRNKEHGYGKLMTSDRQRIIYDGEWERGKIHGTGTYYYGSSNPLKPGSRYIGEFKENSRNGNGFYFLPDGSEYNGTWRDGVMNGRGVFTWPDKSFYDGEWKDGQRNGQGLLKTADGFCYDGSWVNNAMEGRGLAMYPSGQKYEGSFSNGRREGRGTMYFTNSAVYEGRFRDDAVDGQGTMKMSRVMVVPRDPRDGAKSSTSEGKPEGKEEERKPDFMIPISFQSDITHIHTKAGFTAHGE